MNYVKLNIAHSINVQPWKELRLSDGVESIGNLTKFRIPPLVTTLHLHVLGDCQIMFSLELIEKYYSSTISSIRQLLFITKYCPRIQHRG